MLKYFTNTAQASIDTLMARVTTVIINPVLGLVFVAALVYFLYGVVEFLGNRASDDKRKTGKDHMLWGVIGMAIMFSAIAIVNFLKASVFDLFK